MRRMALVTLSLAVLITATAAQAATFYLHEVGSPVPVPGGTTTFVLDENAPVASTPVVESFSIPKQTAATFPTFIAPAFGAPAPLGRAVNVVVHLSANLGMKGCANVTATLERVDSGGGRSLLDQRTVSATVPQGGAGGTVGFAPVTIPLSPPCTGSFGDFAIDTGESIALTLSVSNNCNANRTVFLAYDATTAPGSATFGPVPANFVLACHVKCWTGTSKAAVKFVLAKQKCIDKCIAAARKTPPVNPEADCFAPYGGATLTCIADPLKGAEAKAIAAIDKVCDEVPGEIVCPNCYSARSGPTDCSAWGTSFILDGLSNPPAASLEAQVDAFGFLYCNDVTNHTADETKCQSGTAKALGKFVGCKQKCYDKCNAALAKGTIAAGSCNPPFPADAATVVCLFDSLKGCEAKAIAAVSKACFTPPADPPECYGFTASAIVGLMETAVDGNLGNIYCGSPSGAFLD